MTAFEFTINEPMERNTVCKHSFRSKTSIFEFSISFCVKVSIELFRVCFRLSLVDFSISINSSVSVSLIFEMSKILNIASKLFTGDLKS